MAHSESERGGGGGGRQKERRDRQTGRKIETESWNSNLKL